MIYTEMIKSVREQLAVDLNCTPADLNNKKENFIFCEAKENAGRRPFPRTENHFDMLSMGRSVIISASETLLPVIREQVKGKTKDEAFSLPFVYGHSLYYLPDIHRAAVINKPDGFVYETAERSDLERIYKAEGFNNAVSYDMNNLRPDVLVTAAIYNNKIVGMAGASADCGSMWQVGIDVIPEYRNMGLGVYLIHWLSNEILKRGYIPYYGTASSNIASQKVAHRAGYMPAWMCAYRGNFNSIKTLPTG